MSSSQQVSQQCGVTDVVLDPPVLIAGESPADEPDATGHRTRRSRRPPNTSPTSLPSPPRRMGHRQPSGTYLGPIPRTATASCPAAYSSSATRGDRLVPTEISRRAGQWKLTFLYGCSGVVQRSGDVLGFEFGQVAEDLIHGASGRRAVRERWLRGSADREGTAHHATWLDRS
jgi:hypothetical protein